MDSRLSSAVLIIAIFADCTTNCLEICVDDSIVTTNGSLIVYPPEGTVKLASPLYFGLMVAPSENSDYLNSTVSAVQLALDTINADSDLLRGYSLHYTLTTSQCNESDIADKTISQLFGTPSVCKLGLIVAGCTDGEASLVRTHWVNNFNTPQIACSPTIQDFTDDQNKVFEISPANDVIVPALIELITHYNWTKLALITENKLEYSQITKTLGVLESLNVTLTVTTLTVENHTLKVEGNCDNSLFDSKVRIFLLLMSSETANRLLCEAFKLHINYPKYEFIFVSDHHSDWWVGSPQDDSHYGCSTKERAQVLDHSLTLQWRPSYYQHGSELVNLKVHDRQSLYCYDAVWTLALALNKTLSDVKDVDCVYKDRITAELIHETIQNSSFNGLTGNIRFEASRARSHYQPEVFIKQYTHNGQQTRNESYLKGVQVGTWNDGNLTLNNNNISWPRGVPYDGSPVHVLVTVSVPLVVVYYSLATVGIVFAIICCVFNFAFRKAKVVLLTSPNLNYLIIIGAIFFYVSTYLYFLPSTDPNTVLAACCLQPWLPGTGYCLTIGTIFAKLCRIYYIFKNPDSAKKRTISDGHLLVFILLLAAAVAVELIVYMIVEAGTPGYELSRITNDDYPSDIIGDREVETHYEFYTCSRVPYARTIFIAIVFVLVGIMLVCALFMAFKTRKVQIKGLNDAKYITAIVYITSLDSMVHIIFTFTLKSRVNIFPAAVTGSFMILMTVILGLVFIPKMINVYRDPKGEHMFSEDNAHYQVAQLSTVVNGHTSCTGCQDRQAKLKDLKERMSTQSQNNKDKDTQSKHEEKCNEGNHTSTQQQLANKLET